LSSWWWTGKPSETCRASYRNKEIVKLCILLVVLCEITKVYTYFLTPRCRVLLEKLTGLQLVKKFPAFHETEGSLPHSQASATCLYPGPAQSSLHTHIAPPGDQFIPP
jgi:hypothetical protein